VKDIPPYTIAGGNPAHPIKQRFSDAEVAKLLEIQWWDWDIAKVSRNLHLIMGSNIQALYDAQYC
jgi:virginiamycin A acetyltransferase